MKTIRDLIQSLTCLLSALQCIAMTVALIAFTQQLPEKKSMIGRLQEKLSSRARTEDQAAAIAALSEHPILTNNFYEELRKTRR